MNKIVTILAILLVSASCLSNKQILQLTLNGLFAENNLSYPTTIVPCIDQDTAAMIVVFIGEMLEKGSRGSTSDLVQFINMIKNFTSLLPQQVNDCLHGNVEIMVFQLIYGIDQTSNPGQVEQKIITYMFTHYFPTHKFLIDLNVGWKYGSYYQSGFKSAQYAHKIFDNHQKQIRKSFAFV